MLQSSGRPLGVLALSSLWLDALLRDSGRPLPPAAVRGEGWGGGPSLSTLRVRGGRKLGAPDDEDC